MAMTELPPVQSAAMIEPPWLWWALRAEHGEAGQLAGMALPTSNFDASYLAGLGLDTIVSLIGRQGYDPAPLELHLFNLHNLAGGALPDDVEREERELEAAVAKVGSLLAEGRNVVVHCRAGIGRTGTVIASVLAERGHRTAEIVPWLEQIQFRRTGRREDWPESEWQLRMVEKHVR